MFLDMVFSLCKEKPLKYSGDSRQSWSVTPIADSVEKLCVPSKRQLLAKKGSKPSLKSDWKSSQYY